MNFAFQFRQSFDALVTNAPDKFAAMGNFLVVQGYVATDGGETKAVEVDNKILRVSGFVKPVINGFGYRMFVIASNENVDLGEIVLAQTLEFRSSTQAITSPAYATGEFRYGTLAKFIQFVAEGPEAPHQFFEHSRLVRTGHIRHVKQSRRHRVG